MNAVVIRHQLLDLDLFDQCKMQKLFAVNFYQRLSKHLFWIHISEVMCVLCTHLIELHLNFFGLDSMFCNSFFLSLKGCPFNIVLTRCYFQVLNPVNDDFLEYADADHAAL